MKSDLSPAAVARRLGELRALMELTDYLHRARVVPSRAQEGSRRVSQIRRVEPRDLEAVRRVLVETWHATYDALLGVERVTEITDRWHALEALRREVDRSQHAFLLTECDGVVVATGSASREGDAVSIDRLYVLPAHQRSRLGAALLATLIEELGPAARVEVDVAAGNTGALAFYETHGFTIVERSGEDVRMRRTHG